MRGLHVLAMLLVNLRPTHACVAEAQILICQEVPETFGPGYLSLVLLLKDAGEINSTALQSDSLASVSSLTIDSAGVTGILSRAFASFQNLKRLSVNLNALTQVNPNWFGQPAILTELSLMGNRIEVLSGSMFSGLSNLAKLNLANNRIGTIDPSSLSFQTNLAELDLSGNRMTRVIPQVFRSLRSTRMRLDGNPWDCSCGVQDFVDFLKDLQNRSLLEREMKVTCNSPSSLSGVPVWNVSVCVTASPSQPTAGTQTSLPPEATGAPIVDATTTEMTVVTLGLLCDQTSRSPPPETKTSVQPRPTVTPNMTTEFTAVPANYASTLPSRPASDTTVVHTLIGVIVVLCVLLFVVCFLALPYRRNRNSKTVAPGPSKEDERDLEEDGGLRSTESPAHLEIRDFTESVHWDSETEWRRRVSAVRAKSAHAILFTAPFAVFGRDMGPSEDTNTADVIEKKQEQSGSGRRRNSGQNAPSAPVNAETAPYLSIGASLSKPIMQATDSPGQRSHVGKMGRISTWPPTAVQWERRCNMKAQEEAAGGEVRIAQSKVKPPAGDDGDEQGVASEETHMDESPTALNQNPVTCTSSGSSQISSWAVCHESLTEAEAVCSNPRDKTVESKSRHEISSVSLIDEDQTQTDVRLDEQLNRSYDEIHEAAAMREQPSGNRDRSPAATEQIRETPAETSKGHAKVPRGEYRGAGSKAPSGGDETQGFVDLLHEVVQNHGRWTRERWRQTHLNKQQGC